VQTVSASVEVEAATPQDAADDFYQSDDMPGQITIGAFGNAARVDEAGEWYAIEVTDEAGKVLWTGGPS
jgi:hypothetical protein